jgi:glycosyltransferase involved in cell wall biosynthesis
LTENKRRQKYFLKTQLVFLITYLIERATIRSCDSFLVLSQFSKNLLAKTYQIPKSKITIIPAGIDINKFCPTQNKQLVRRQLNLPHNIPILFTIRRLVARMGLENLIEAMSLVTKERNVLLIIGGKGYLEAQLKKLISKYRLEEHVKLIGYIPDDTLPLYYQAADLFVLPTVAYEGFGLVTLEALSCGIPAIGTKVGGTVEILEKFDNKLLVSSNNPKNLAQGIIATLVRKDLNSSRCRQFVIENYCWDGIFQQIENFFIGVKNEHHVHQPYIYNKWCRGKYA